MTKTVQIGDVFGDVKEVRLQENQTLQDALDSAGLTMSSSQQLISNSDSRPVSVNDIPVENEVYLVTSNQTSG